MDTVTRHSSPKQQLRYYSIRSTKERLEEHCYPRVRQYRFLKHARALIFSPPTLAIDESIVSVTEREFSHGYLGSSVARDVCQPGQISVMTFAHRAARAVGIVRCAFDNCERFCAVQPAAVEETVKPRNIK